MPAPNLSSGSPKRRASIWRYRRRRSRTRRPCTGHEWPRWWLLPEAHRGGEVEVENLAPRLRALRIACHLLLEVEPRGKAAPGAAQHDRAHIRVGLERVHGVVDLEEHALPGALRRSGRCSSSCATWPSRITRIDSYLFIGCRPRPGQARLPPASRRSVRGRRCALQGSRAK